jgi:predicted Zn-dependent protease
MDALDFNTRLVETVRIRMSRKEKILAMLADEPNDPFLRYSLAMELRKEDNNEESIALLKQLAYDPSVKYVAAYFMAAQQLAELGRVEDARGFLRDGIEEARLQNNLHAAAEMSELLQELGK